MILRTNSKKIQFSDKIETAINPPYINKGGNSQKPQFTAIIDYLSFTFCPENPREILRGNPNSNLQLKDTLQDYTEWALHRLSTMITNFRWIPTNNGYSGYERSYKLFRDDESCGLAAFGGNNDSILISLTGKGCSMVDMREICKFIESQDKWKITRVDCAHDDLEGGNSIEYWKTLADQGAFNGIGRPPMVRKIINSDKGRGDTVYIGRKQNGKEACIYEKGKQLGSPLSPHVRVEGRFYSVDRVIPLDILTEPAKYLAGMYPPFSILSAIYEKIKIVRDQLTTSLSVLTNHARNQYGKLISYLYNDLGMSSAEIIGKVLKPGIPKRIIPYSARHMEQVA